MYLTKLTLTNFRCYENIEFDGLGRLAIFIGENDAGKTVLLDAVEILAGRKAPTARDFRRMADGSAAEVLSLGGVFNLDDSDTVPEQWIASGALHVRRTFRCDSAILSDVRILGQGYSDDRFDGFTGLKADEQKDLLKEYDLTPASNAAGRVSQRDQLAAEGKLTLVERWIRLQPSDVTILNTHLPLIERIASTEYKHPEAVIQRRLQAVAAQVMNPVDAATGTATELGALSTLRAQIEDALNEEIDKVVPILQHSHRKLKRVIARPTIDFTRAVTASTMILDCGEGEQGLETFGEGTKKRIWMGLLEWESQGGNAGDVRNVIRLYDEPDINLHYQAQRQMFQNILDLVDEDGSRTQCLVCTHSMQLIDRAPIAAVTLIRIEDDSHRTACRIQGLEDADYTDFYNDVGQAVGLTNTALLYERAFLVVEGESEYEAIPIIYKNLYNRDMRDDGIRLIDLSTCGAWRSILKVLLRNRLDLVHLLLDKDCDSPQSSAYVKPSVLQELGCPPDFETEHITYIGDKEFEDAFHTDLIWKGVRSAFQFPDGCEWEPERIDTLKVTSSKFSEDLKDEIRQTCLPSDRNKAKKHYIAKAVARQCTCEADVPSALRKAIMWVRGRAGVV